ncbi:MAG: diguanylate cyclase [Motiliproteus sp.]
MAVFRKIGHRVIAAVGLVVIVGLMSMAWFYTTKQEQSILRQNEISAEKVTTSVIRGLQTVMLAGYADIAEAYAGSLKSIPGVHDFRIMRATGLEAFKDNATIESVNERRGEEEFYPRDEELQLPVMQPDDAFLNKAVKGQRTIHYYDETASGEMFLTFLVPIENQDKCHKCHGSDHRVRGVVKFTTTLDEVQHEISETRFQSVLVLLGATLLILSITGLLIRRTIVDPIERITGAMESVSRGNLSEQVPVLGKDELSSMARSFNRMSSELQTTYTGLHQEQNKLTTVILSAQEGIIVTGPDGHVVLANPAAVRLLKKNSQEIINAGFKRIFDDVSLMDEWLKNSEFTMEPNLFEYHERMLSVSVSVIRDENSILIGSSALIRDITEQKNLEDELRTLSHTDGLTGLYNRRFMDETLIAETLRGYRYGQSLSVLMFDVDHFKKFNDNYGHDQGDEVLKAIAVQMRHTVRCHDFPCRYGGEEFLIILPNTTFEGAIVLAERLRKNIEDMRVDDLKVTISVGVGNLETHRPKDAADFVSICDTALYQAKENGRNRVELAVIPKQEKL